MLLILTAIVLATIQVSTCQSIWPLPRQMTTTDVLYSIDPSDFKFLVTGAPDVQKSLILKDSTRRTRENAFLNNCSRVGLNIDHEPPSSCRLVQPSVAKQLKNLTIQIHHKCEEYPHPDMDEMYTLRINSPDFPDQAVLFADNIWGAIRGLQSFSQLVYYSEKDDSFLIKGAFILDYPRFSYRGVLVDTSRHYIPLKLIYQNLDAMEYNKMNVLHWHIVDDQSFPYVSEAFPSMSRFGAYNPKTHIYTRDDINAVKEYARLRGIRVLPEFDTPGHTLSWGKGVPGLLAKCYNTTTKKPNGTFGPVDPTKNSTYEFLEKFFIEVSQVFDDQYIHLGGDEVEFKCWQSNPDINDFMEKMGIKGYKKLEEYFMQKLVNIVDNLKKSYIVWQEVYDNGLVLNKDTVVHVWMGNAVDEWRLELKNVTASGFRTILSSPWYLNYIHYGPDWTVLYKEEPMSFSDDPKLQQLMLGGELTMWTEFVDGSNFMSRTWPRGAAVAERLWSDRTVNNTGTALPRIREHACRMQSRGLRIEPINGPGFCPCDYKYID